MLFKHFGYIDGTTLETAINNWIHQSPNIKTLDFDYQVINSNGEIWHYALVYYEPKNIVQHQTSLSQNT